MLDPDQASRTAATHAPHPAAVRDALGSPHALQILTTEHWSLLASRSFVYTEAMSRTGIFIASLTGSGGLSMESGRWGVVGLLLASGLVKSVVALTSGGRRYGLVVAVGLLGAVAAAGVVVGVTAA